MTDSGEEMAWLLISVVIRLMDQKELITLRQILEQDDEAKDDKTAQKWLSLVNKRLKGG